MTPSKADSSSSSNTRTRVAVLSLGDRPEIKEERERLYPLIQQHADVVLQADLQDADLSALDAEAIIVLGGDGSILRTAHQMATRQLPVIGVNLGHLGFLAHYLPDELEGVIKQFCKGEYRIVEHLMFTIRVLRGDQVLHEKLGLNEVAVLAGAPFRILDVQLYVDSELATTYSCDGLIVSTPVGSTAHSLSAGGPILRKNLQAFVISPISPHTLTNRPVVDTADRKYELVVPKPHEGTSLVVDGGVLCRITSEDRIEIERAPVSFKLVEVTGHGYYRTLREKLGWSGRLLKE